MNKTKLLSFAVIALLLLNFGILGFLFFSGPKRGHFHPDHDEKPQPKEIIIEKLHFDNNQIASYDKLIELHRAHIRKLQDNSTDSKNELYLLLNQESVNVAKKDSLIENLAQLQKEIETTHFNHFQDIKKLCKKEQLLDFKLLTEELSKIFSHSRKPKNE